MLVATLPLVKPVRSRPGRRAVAKVETVFLPDETFLAELDPSWELLPAIDGTGLTPEEYATVCHRAARVRADVARDMPEATSADLDSVRDRAAADALKAVLAKRPQAELEADVDFEWDAPSDPIEWPEWTDEDVWTADDAPALALADVIALEALRYRSLDNGLGDLVADRLTELVRDIHSTDATRPELVEARLQILEDHFTAPGEYC